MTQVWLSTVNFSKYKMLAQLASSIMEGIITETPPIRDLPWVVAGGEIARSAFGSMLSVRNLYGRSLVYS